VIPGWLRRLASRRNRFETEFRKEDGYAKQSKNRSEDTRRDVLGFHIDSGRARPDSDQQRGCRFSCVSGAQTPNRANRKNGEPDAGQEGEPGAWSNQRIGFEPYSDRGTRWRCCAFGNGSRQRSGRAGRRCGSENRRRALSPESTENYYSSGVERYFPAKMPLYPFGPRRVNGTNTYRMDLYECHFVHDGSPSMTTTDMWLAVRCECRNVDVIDSWKSHGIDAPARALVLLAPVHHVTPYLMRIGA
jgi:hypothetical protein